MHEPTPSVVGSGAPLSELVELLMLTPPSDRVAHGDAMTAQQVSELLGADRSEVATAWRAVAAEHAKYAEDAGWSGTLGLALEGLEGVATLRELATASTSVCDGADPERAYALSRVTVESKQHAALAWRRSGVTVLVSATGGDRQGASDTYLLMAHASELSHVVSALMSSGDVVGVDRLAKAVAISPELGALAGMSGARLSELAAAQVPHVLTNRRRDLYLAELKPVHALAAVAKSLPPRAVTVGDLERRVRGRFPGALPLPRGTALDDAVRIATGRTRGPTGYRHADDG